MTDTSSDPLPKGLLPQLTEVLAALTESHDLLARKIEELRLLSAARSPEHEQLPDTDTHVPDESHPAAPVDPRCGGEMAQQAGSVWQASDQEGHTDVTAHRSDDDKAASSPGGPRDERTSVTHDYNFFDELDTRLANIEDDSPADPGLG